MFLHLSFIPSSIGQDLNDKNYSSDAANSCQVVILGTTQDGGSPHAGCKKKCCKDLFEADDLSRKVVCLGIIDNMSKMNWLVEATPDLTTQMKNLQYQSNFDHAETPDGILLTHAHIGHYTGLMFLGKEVMNSSNVKVYSMDRMASFLKNNGPWSQLVSSKNIKLLPLTSEEETRLSDNISVQAIIVPHRDEFSETVGFIISGPTKKLLFIPDIDKWSLWKNDIINIIEQVDMAFLDATFYDGNETPNRDISEIPHPYVIESMTLFENLSLKQKAKIHFIHMNHTNPLLQKDSKEYKHVISSGYNIAEQGMILKL